MDERKLLVKVAEMYYLEDKNQNQISKELGIHRTTISRLLKKSRENQIVQITINYDLAGTYPLEKEIEDIFGLKKAIIVPVATDMRRDQKDQLLGEALDAYLDIILKNDLFIGISWGQTLATISDCLSKKRYSNITCVPLIGGPSGRLISEFHVNTIVHNISKKLNARALLIDAPAIVKSKNLKKELLLDDFNQKLVNIWKHIDIAIFGIGSPNLSTNKNWQDFYGEDILKKISKDNVVGDIVSRFYNPNGEIIHSELDDRIIGISIDKLLDIPIRIGVAESTEKSDAILGALRGTYANVLITTEETARDIIKKQKNT